jgi:hypothetical protein
VRDFVGLHSWASPHPLDVWCEEMDAAARSVQLVLVAEDRGGAERKYCRAGLPSISLYLDRQEDNCQTWGVVSHDAFMALGQDSVGRLFVRIVNALLPTLARSFNELAHGVIKTSELGGALEFIDWFQYLSPSVAACLGKDVLSRVPQASVEVLPSGGCFLWLPGSPIDVLSGRRGVAEALGITLRPLVARNPKTGEPITIPWS